MPSRKRAKPKAQSALELLFNYAWAFIIIAIVIGVILYFITLPRTIVPTSCSLTTGVTCKALMIGTPAGYSTSQINLVLVNGEEYDIISNSVAPSYAIINITTPDYGPTKLLCTPSNIISGGEIICSGSLSSNIPQAVALSGTITFNSSLCISGNEENCAAQRETTYVGNFTGYSSGGPQTKPLSAAMQVYASASLVAVSSPDLITVNVKILGNPSASSPVTFTVSSPYATISPQVSLTDSNGNASAYFYSSTPGTYTITASFDNFSNTTTITVSAAITTSSSSTSTSSTTTVLGYPSLIAAAPTATQNVVDEGTTITLYSHASGGSGAYTNGDYQWYNNNKGTCSSGKISGATGINYSTMPPTTGGYLYEVYDPITGQSACSPSLTVDVNPTYTVTLLISPGGPSSLTFNGVVYNSGGSATLEPAKSYTASISSTGFLGWTTLGGADAHSPTSSSTAVSATSDGTLEAAYTCYTVTINTAANGAGTGPCGGVTVSPAGGSGINSACSEIGIPSGYLAGTTVNAIATFGTDESFDKWTGTGTGSYSGSGSAGVNEDTAQIVLSGNIMETATCAT